MCEITMIMRQRRLFMELDYIMLIFIDNGTEI